LKAGYESFEHRLRQIRSFVRVRRNAMQNAAAAAAAAARIGRRTLRALDRASRAAGRALTCRRLSN